MQIPKQFFHDRTVLLLSTVNTFLTALTSIMILLRLDGIKAQSYIIQHRENLGVNEFKSGGSGTLIQIVVFAVMILALHEILSMKIYESKRNLAVTILGIGTLVLILSFLVGYSLLENS